MTAPHVLARICTLATERNLSTQHDQWLRLRECNPSGVASMGNEAGAGNGVFWSESNEVAGIVFLWRPGRVLTALEVQNVYDGRS